jgi:hypothetical protein
MVALAIILGHAHGDGACSLSFNVCRLGNTRDGGYGEASAPLQLITPNLPDATDYKAERECSRAS